MSGPEKRTVTLDQIMRKRGPPKTIAELSAELNRQQIQLEALRAKYQLISTQFHKSKG